MNACEELLCRGKYISAFNQYFGQPVYIYGAGQMGKGALQYLLRENVNIRAYIDKNPNIWGQKIQGIPIIGIDEVPEIDRAKCLIAIGITKFSYNSIVEELKQKGYMQSCYLGHLINSVYKGPSIANVWYFEEMRDDEREQITYIYEHLVDEGSRQAWLQALEWNLYGNENERPEGMCLPEDKYFIPEVKRCLTSEEIFIDCGAYTGTTIERIEKATDNQYKAIYSFEPEPNNFLMLIDFLNKDINRREKVSAYDFGLGNVDGERNFTVGLDLTSRYVADDCGTKRKIRKLDSVIGDIPYSFLKVYGLGIGREVLQGGARTIKRNRPIIAANIYHTKEDFLGIPMWAINELEEYNIYLRLHGYCGGEVVVYAIPKER